MNRVKKDNPGSKVQELGFLTRKYLDLIELFLRDLLWLKLDRKIVNNLYQEKLRDLSNKPFFKINPFFTPHFLAISILPFK